MSTANLKKGNMKIAIPTLKDKPKTGKGYMIKRLAEGFRKLGHAVVTDNGDVALHVGKRYKCKAKKHVLRLGALHIDKNQKWKKLNAPKKEAYEYADGVVYQSHFSRKLVHQFFGGASCHEAIIHNAATLDAEPFESDFKVNFLAAAREWLPQKRMGDIVEAFIKAEIPDSCLWIAGNGKSLDNHYNSIRYMGLVLPETLARLMAMANALIHIVWIDASPNVVAEAQAIGCPVICSANGGTKELVTNGKVLGLEQPYTFKPVNLKKPPKANTDLLAQTMTEYVEKGERTKEYDWAAIRYIEFFNKVLYGH